MNLIILDEAQKELADAITRYEGIEPALPYLIRNDTVWVIAIAHVHRRPLYWIRRRIRA